MKAVVRGAWAAVLGAALVGVPAGAGAQGPQGPSSSSPAPAVRAFGPLAELPAGHWAYRSLDELIRAGVVVEYSAGAFDQERTITRYEAALLLVDAYRRAGAVGEGAGGAVRLRTLLTQRLVEATPAAAGREERMRELLVRLAQELSEELQVLGYVAEGVDVSRTGSVAVDGVLELRSSGSAPRPAPAGPGSAAEPAPAGERALSEPATPGAPLTSSGETGAGVAPAAAPQEPPGDLVAPPAGTGQPPRAAAPPGVSDNAASYELGLRLALTGRADVDGQVDLSTMNPTRLGVLLVGPGQDRWVWARVGPLDSPAGSELAMGDAEALTLQGIEARLLGSESRTGLVIASPELPGDDTEDPAASRRVIAVLDGSLALSRQIVVGGALVRGSQDPLDLWKLDRGTTVTALSGRYSPVPWLSITGEYAQNLRLAPVSGSALRLGATLDLGELRLGARVGRVAPDFEPVLGPATPGDQVGVDATVRLGDVQVRAGTERRRPDDGTGQAAPEHTTSVGVRVGLVPGASVSAEYELVSVEDLEQGPGRSRTRVGLDWEATAARVQLGVEWEAAAGGTDPVAADVDATAALSYQLNPYAAVMLGYHLIDFGGDEERAGATARLTLRF